MPWVAYIRIKERQFQIRLDPERSYTVGRGRQCDIRINDTAVSRRHCKLTHEGEGWRIVDLGSKHGFRVGTAQTRGHLIDDGDRIGFGHHSRIRFKVHDDDENVPVQSPARRRPGTGLVITLVLAGVLGVLGHRHWDSVEDWYHRTFPPDEASTPTLAELEAFVRNPDPAAVGRLFALDAALARRPPTTAEETQEHVRLAAALLQALLAAVRSGDKQALDHLIERADRLGVVEGLFKLGPGGVRAVLDATDDARIDSLDVAPYIEKIRDAGSFPRLQKLVAKPDAEVHLRLQALNVLASHDAPPPADELRRIVAEARSNPWDRSRALMGQRAAALLARHDPEFAALAREHAERRRRRHEAPR